VTRKVEDKIMSSCFVNGKSKMGPQPVASEILYLRLLAYDQANIVMTRIPIDCVPFE